MKRASQPICLRSNQPNISVGRSTTAGNTRLRRRAFPAASLLSVYQSDAADSTTEELIWTI